MVFTPKTNEDFKLAINFYFSYSNDNKTTLQSNGYDIYEIGSFNDPNRKYFIKTWNTSYITNMSETFKNRYAFNEDIGEWDVSNVVNMNSMFYSAYNFNQNIGSWKVGNVRNMTKMFYAAESFNQDISSWDTSNLIFADYMFYLARRFNQDIGIWDVSNLITAIAFFRHAYSFNQDIGNWDVSNVENMTDMFYHATSFNQNLSNWNVKNISTIPNNFSQLSSLISEYHPLWGETVAGIQDEFIQTEEDTTVQNNYCNLDGGIWPTGEPTPTRTWSRAEDPNCWKADGYTNEDLNMRRKAETLQHKNNNAGWTKKDQFAYYAKRSKTVSNGASAVAAANASSCINKPVQSFPASASNVPGKGSLYLDRSVPLTGWRWQRIFKAGGGQNTMFTFDYRNQAID